MVTILGPPKVQVLPGMAGDVSRGVSRPNCHIQQESTGERVSALHPGSISSIPSGPPSLSGVISFYFGFWATPQTGTQEFFPALHSEITPWRCSGGHSRMLGIKPGLLCVRQMPAPLCCRSSFTPSDPTMCIVGIQWERLVRPSVSTLGAHVSCGGHSRCAPCSCHLGHLWHLWGLVCAISGGLLSLIDAQELELGECGSG